MYSSLYISFFNPSTFREFDRSFRLLFWRTNFFSFISDLKTNILVGSMLCGRNSKGSRGGSVPVYLNVYDLTSMNGYAYWLGLGVYHSGVQVHGIEYAFGAHEYPTTGIFEGEPKQCEGFTFRKAILIGWTEMGIGDVRGVMEEELAQLYKGNAYNLIAKNCNHFSNDACVRLTGNPIPSWVNRLARIGLLCNCIVPVGLNSTKVGHHRIEDNVYGGEKKKLRSRSNRFTFSSNSSSPPSSSPTTRNHPFILASSSS